MSEQDQHRDDLLDQLGALAREERAAEPDDPRLDDLLAGRLSDDEEAALIAEVGPEAELFRPFDAAAQARMVDRVLAEQAPPATVIPLRRRRHVWTGVAVAALAAAAALAFVLLRPGVAPAPVPDYALSAPVPDYALSAPVPDYALSATGGEKVLRGDPAAADAVRRLSPGAQLELVLTPAAPVIGAPAVRGFVVPEGVRGGRVRPWPISPEIAPEGAVRVAGTLESLGLATLTPGDWTLVLAVGRPDALPATPAALEAALSTPPVGADATWRLLRLHVRLAGTGR